MATLYSLQLFRPEIPHLLHLLHSYTSSPSSATDSDSRAPARSIPACSHHCIPTRSPGAFSEPSHRSNSYRVAIYCATVFWSRLMYSSIVKNPASSCDVSPRSISTSFPVSYTGAVPSAVSPPGPEIPPGPCPCGGVTTQVSDLKSSTTFTTALKNNPDNHGAAPSLLRMLSILLQTDLSRDKLLTTAKKSSSAAVITRPKYLKEVTIFSGHP